MEAYVFLAALTPDLSWFVYSLTEMKRCGRSQVTTLGDNRRWSAKEVLVAEMVSSLTDGSFVPS